MWSQICSTSAIKVTARSEPPATGILDVLHRVISRIAVGETCSSSHASHQSPRCAGPRRDRAPGRVPRVRAKFGRRAPPLMPGFPRVKRRMAIITFQTRSATQWQVPYPATKLPTSALVRNAPGEDPSQTPENGYDSQYVAQATRSFRIIDLSGRK